MTIFIGTSGWAYREWRGTFYPTHLKADDLLRHYVTQFSAVEINGTAYRTPTSEIVHRWRDVMPKGFVAALKMSHKITHFHRLRETGTLLEDFITSARELSNHVGPLLAQLPPGFAPDHVRLRDFVTNARKIMGDANWPLVVEFRHPEWFSERTAEILMRANAAWCVADMPIAPISKPLTDTPVLYLRRHGTSGKYSGFYDDAALLADAELLCTYSERGINAFAFFNNTADGAAVHNARRLKELVAECLNRSRHSASEQKGSTHE